MWSRWVRLAGVAPLVVCGLLLVLLAVCYIVQPDACVAASVWPAWVWVIPGVLLACAAGVRRRRRVVGLAIVCWLAFGLVFSEESVSLLRALSRPHHTSTDRGLRVITLK